MSNSLGNYDETFFAQEALIQLEKALGMASRVHRDYEPATKSQGSVIQIRRPSTFTAQSAPSTAQDLQTGEVSLTLDQWKEVKFKLSDKELALSSDRIISDHIRPAAYALADNVDQALAALYTKIPYYSTYTATPALSDITAQRKVLRDNQAPLNDGMMHLMLDSAAEAAFLNALSASGMQPNQQDSAIRKGSLGELFGVEVFANQNAPDHTSGTSADATGAVDFGSGTTAVYAAGTTTLHVDGMTNGGTGKIGDSLVFAGHSQRYVLTADVTFTSGEADISIYPALKQAVDEDEVVTLHLGGAAKAQRLMFHRNAFALAMAPLPRIGNELGARISSIVDPKTGLALRARMYYVGNSSEVHVALDVLYGVTVLDPNLGVRGYAA